MAIQLSIHFHFQLKNTLPTCEYDMNMYLQQLYLLDEFTNPDQSSINQSLGYSAGCSIM